MSGKGLIGKTVSVTGSAKNSEKSIAFELDDREAAMANLAISRGAGDDNDE